MKHTDERTPPVPPSSSQEPVRLVDRYGHRHRHSSFDVPDHAVLAELQRAMVIGRRFNRRAGALARQGHLAIYPSSTGREAIQVGGALALSERDWLFPGHRDSVAMITHGVDPVRTLALFHGDRRRGYEPHHYRCAPRCTPPATNASQAVELTYAARHKGRDVAALVLISDESTGEGDAREAYEFAAMWNTPVVFLVQNSRRTVTVPGHGRNPVSAPTHQALEKGTRDHHVDGDDAAAVYSVVTHALAEARAGGGPTIVEAFTHRVDPRLDSGPSWPRWDTNEVDHRTVRDPLVRLEALLRNEQVVDDDLLRIYERDAERVATAIGEGARRCHLTPEPLPT